MGRGLPHGRPRPRNAESHPLSKDICLDHRIGAKDRTAFIRANTRLMDVPHAPEIRLHLADEAFSLWHRTEEELEALGLPAPFWAFAWAGGQALARYVLDNKALAAGRRVVDVGSGSGLVAIAAARAGAAHVLAADPDPFTPAAIALNAAANGVQVETTTEDLLDDAPPPCDLLLIGDMFFDREIAPRMERFARRALAAGADVLIGDPGRAYLPRERLEQLALYEVPVSRALEDNDVKRTRVWRVKA
ncbi:MAG: methyltransferase [Rhodobiaceae bacterium]|nr:methyltransferase [Rhodobiaceae bacterium]